jgi:hypothetical protein
VSVAYEIFMMTSEQNSLGIPMYTEQKNNELLGVQCVPLFRLRKVCMEEIELRSDAKGVHLCLKLEPNQYHQVEAGDTLSEIKDRKQSSMGLLLRRPSVFTKFKHQQSKSGLGQEDEDEDDEVDEVDEVESRII